VGWIPLTPWGGCGVGGGVREPSVGVENVVADQNGDIIQRLVCDETVRWLLGKAYRLFLGGHNEVRLFFFIYVEYYLLLLRRSRCTETLVEVVL
jgi:hypothetical protein